MQRSQVMFIGKFGPIALNFGQDVFLLVNLFWDTLCVKIWTSFENFPAFSKKRIQHFRSAVQDTELHWQVAKKAHLELGDELESESRKDFPSRNISEKSQKRIEVKYIVYKPLSVRVELKIQISWKLFKFCNRREHGCFAIIGLIGRFCRPWQFSDGRAGSRADENMYVLFLFLILFLDPKKKTENEIQMTITVSKI